MIRLIFAAVSWAVLAHSALAENPSPPLSIEVDSISSNLHGVRFTVPPEVTPPTLPDITTLVDLSNQYKSSGQSATTYFRGNSTPDLVATLARIRGALKLPYIRGPVPRPPAPRDFLGNPIPQPLQLEFGERQAIQFLNEGIVAAIQGRYKTLCASDLVEPSLVLYGIPLARIESLSAEERVFYSLGCQALAGQYPGAEAAARAAYLYSRLGGPGALPPDVKLALELSDLPTSERETWAAKNLTTSVSDGEGQELSSHKTRITLLMVLNTTQRLGCFAARLRQGEIAQLRIGRLERELVVFRQAGNQAEVRRIQAEIQAIRENPGSVSSGFRPLPPTTPALDSILIGFLSAQCQTLESVELSLAKRFFALATSEEVRLLASVSSEEQAARLAELGSQAGFAEIATTFRSEIESRDAAETLALLQKHFQYLRDVLKVQIAVSTETNRVSLVAGDSFLDRDWVTVRQNESADSDLGLYGLTDLQRNLPLSLGNLVILPPVKVGDKYKLPFLTLETYQGLVAIENNATLPLERMGIYRSQGKYTAHGTEVALAEYNTDTPDNRALRLFFDGLGAGSFQKIFDPNRTLALDLGPTLDVVFLPVRNGKTVSISHAERARRTQILLDDFSRIYLEFQIFVSQDPFTRTLELTAGIHGNGNNLSNYQAAITNFGLRLNGVIQRLREELGYRVDELKALNDAMLQVSEWAADALFNSALLIGAAPFTPIIVVAAPAPAALGAATGIGITTLEYAIGRLVDGKTEPLTVTRVLAAGGLGLILGPAVRIPAFGKILIAGLSLNGAIVAGNQFSQQNYGTGTLHLVLSVAGLANLSATRPPSAPPSRPVATVPQPPVAPSRLSLPDYQVRFPSGKTLFEIKTPINGGGYAFRTATRPTVEPPRPAVEIPLVSAPAAPVPGAGPGSGIGTSPALGGLLQSNGVPISSPPGSTLVFEVGGVSSTNSAVAGALPTKNPPRGFTAFLDPETGEWTATQAGNENEYYEWDGFQWRLRSYRGNRALLERHRGLVASATTVFLIEFPGTAGSPSTLVASSQLREVELPTFPRNTGQAYADFIDQLIRIARATGSADQAVVLKIKLPNGNVKRFVIFGFLGKGVLTAVFDAQLLGSIRAALRLPIVLEVGVSMTDYLFGMQALSTTGAGLAILEHPSLANYSTAPSGVPFPGYLFVERVEIIGSLRDQLEDNPSLFATIPRADLLKAMEELAKKLALHKIIGDLHWGNISLVKKPDGSIEYRVTDLLFPVTKMQAGDFANTTPTTLDRAFGHANNTVTTAEQKQEMVALWAAYFKATVNARVDAGFPLNPNPPAGTGQIPSLDASSSAPNAGTSSSPDFGLVSDESAGFSSLLEGLWSGTNPAPYTQGRPAPLPPAPPVPPAPDPR